MSDSIRVSVFKRNGRKFFYTQYRDPVTGDKVVRSTGTTNRRDAERFAVRWERVLQEGRSGRSCRMSWRALADRYLDEVVPGFKETSQEKARSDIGGYERLLKPKMLRDVTDEALSRYQSILRQRGLKEETIKGYFSVISPMMRWAKRQKLISVVPRVLKELMRHESIATTERYYLGHNAQATAAVLWDKYRQESPSPKVASATLGDTSAINP